MFKPSTVTAWLLVLVFSSAAVAAAPEARLDRTRIGEGETVVLSVTVPGGGMGKPDLSALTRDFDILNSSQSMHMSMINGRSSSSQSWQFVLAPKRIGKIEVPAVTVDGVSTKPLGLEVLPAAEAAKLGPGVPVSLEIESEPEQPYVQQKVIYTVRLLTRVPLSRVAISEPRVRDAMVEPLGPEREYSSQRGSQQYRVIERRYALFPQRSGPLEIEGPVLSAQLPEQNQRNGRGQRFPGRDPFADFDRLFGRSGFPDFGSALAQTRPIQQRGQTLALDVKAQPAGTPSPWLPAESVSLNDTWSSDPPVFRVGEPVTRTIAITAQGLSAAQLPELAVEAPAGIKVYPDKSQAQTRADGDTLISQKILKAALVPSRAGRFTLPEMQLAWWDTRNDKAGIARLPAREVEVLPAPAGSAPPPVDSAPAVAAAPAAQPRSSVPTQAGQAGILPETTPGKLSGNGPDTGLPGPGYWPWIAAALALAWLATIGLWLRGRRTRGAGPAVPAESPAVPVPNTRKLLAQVEQACRANDPVAARRTLLEWAAAYWPQDPPRRIDTLAQRLGGDAPNALGELDQSLYSGSSRPWNGIAAWEGISVALQRSAASGASSSEDSALPPLYPKGA